VLSGTVGAGTYANDTGFLIEGLLTLDGGGDPAAMFVFTAPSLASAADSEVVLVNGASAKNVFWCVSGTAELGADSDLRGTVIAEQSIVAGSGALVVGRLVALSGSVTTSHGMIVLP